MIGFKKLESRREKASEDLYDTTLIGERSHINHIEKFTCKLKWVELLENLKTSTGFHLFAKN
jgi:hypothetical protein